MIKRIFVLTASVMVIFTSVAVDAAGPPEKGLSDIADSAMMSLSQLTSPIKPAAPALPGTTSIPTQLAPCRSGVPIDPGNARCVKVFWSKRICNEDGKQLVSSYKGDIDWQGGRVFFATLEQNRDYGTILERLRAFRITDGALLWQKQNPGGLEPRMYCHGALTYANNRLFIVWDEGLDAYSAGDGSFLWKAPKVQTSPKTTFGNSSLLIKDQKIFADMTVPTGARTIGGAPSPGSGIRVFDQLTGQELWRINQSLGVGDPLFVDNLLCLNGASGGIKCWSVMKRTPLWSISPLGLSRTAKGFYNNQVFMGVGTQIFAVDSSTGQITNKYSQPNCMTLTNIANKSQQYCGGPKDIVSPFAFYNNLVIFVDNSGFIHAINLLNGSRVWSAEGAFVGFHERQKPLIVNGVLVFHGRNAINFLEAATGRPLISIPVPQSLVSLDAEPRGTAIVARTFENLMLIAPRN